MYGHAVAELERRGVTVEAKVVERATAGLRFLLGTRGRTPGDLVALCHPWESGCDDSPRWDDWGSGTPRWFDKKGALLEAIERTGGGSPIRNPRFAVGSAGFNALIAFNALELASVTGDATLREDGVELAQALDDRWDDELATWVDDGPSASGSGRARTLDALLGVLVCDRPAALDQLLDAGAHGAPFGPTGVHRSDPTFSPHTYWRGGAWPQLSYLLWVAATRSGERSVADGLSRSMIDGAEGSGFSEYWDPDSGAGLGARPQSWTTLALLVA
jgi:hypothetical protein